MLLLANSKTLHKLRVIGLLATKSKEASEKVCAKAQCGCKKKNKKKTIASKKTKIFF